LKEWTVSTPIGLTLYGVALIP